MEIFLNPESIRTLALVLLNAVLTWYLLRLRGEKGAAGWLAVFTAGMVGFYLARGILATVVPLSSGARWGLDLVEALSATVGLGALVQFAHRFLECPFRREARWTLAAWVLATGGVVALAVIAPDESSGPLGMAFTTLWLVGELWACMVLLRKRRHASTDRSRKAYGAFALICLADAIILFLIFGSNFVPIPDGVMEAIWVFGILPAIFALHYGRIAIYINYAPEPSSLRVKLVGLGLALVLGITGMAGILSSERLELLGDNYPALADGAAVRFEPTNGGYQIVPTRALPEADIGSVVDPSEGPIDLGIVFSFAGRLRSEAWVGPDGVITFDGFPTISGRGVSFRQSGPAISPLFAVFPVDRLSLEARSVSIRREPGRTVLTWRIPVEASEAVRQVILEASGGIEFRYRGLGDLVVSGGRGLHMGEDAPVVEADLMTDGIVPAGASVEDPVGRRVIRQIHERMVGFLMLMLVAAVFALVAFPLALRGSLVRPVARLLDGVRRVNAGERDVTVSVGVRDEVGRLTEGFNTMTASLRDAEAELRAYAGDLERRVEARTAELAASTAEVETQARRLEEMDRLKTRFFANISHEFRTPLTLLLGPIEDALSGRYGTVDPQLADQLPVMQRNARRLLDLINQLLDLAKLEARGLDLNRQPADLVALARGVVGTFASRAEREGVALLFDASVSSRPAAVDAAKIEGVLTNLLANALAFTQRGGKVRVSVRAESDEAILSVEDTGTGIPAEDLPHVFDRFRQVDGSATRTHEGTGIGLALAKELVEMHDGTIQVESAVGFGTRFTVQIPTEADGVELGVEDEGAQPAPQIVVPASVPEPVDIGGDGVAPPVVEADEDRPIVLVVEDNADLRAFIRGHLASQYRVIEAADGQAGLDAARRHHPDLVLSDVMMPEMDGVALVRALKADADLADVPIVLLTARADEDSRLEGLGAGADDYLAKPFSPAELRARVDNFVAARRQMRERYSDELVVGPSRIVVPSMEGAFLERLHEIAEAHVADAAFGVDRLAEEVGLSRRQLGRRLREAMDTSPGAFLREMRLARAAQLLEQESGTVSEVAYAVGYRDPEHFSKQFRKAYGVVPSAYGEQRSV